jgi:hypothetical protein
MCYRPAFSNLRTIPAVGRNLMTCRHRRPWFGTPSVYGARVRLSRNGLPPQMARPPPRHQLRAKLARSLTLCVGRCVAVHGTCTAAAALLMEHNYESQYAQGFSNRHGRSDLSRAGIDPRRRRVHRQPSTLRIPFMFLTNNSQRTRRRCDEAYTYGRVRGRQTHFHVRNGDGAIPGEPEPRTARHMSSARAAC